MSVRDNELIMIQRPIIVSRVGDRQSPGQNTIEFRMSTGSVEAQ